MESKPINTAHPGPYTRALADFRYTLRRFLHFSEEAAGVAGVAPQQHQLLLQIAGAPANQAVSVSYLAERLFLRHHSVVELCNRCAEAGLIQRTPSTENRRTILLHLTPAGNRLLSTLSRSHARELTELGPQLVAALRSLTKPTPVLRRTVN